MTLIKRHRKKSSTDLATCHSSHFYSCLSTEVVPSSGFYDTRWKWDCYFFSAHQLIMPYICTKLHEEILNSFKVIEQTWNITTCILTLKCDLDLHWTGLIHKLDMERTQTKSFFLSFDECINIYQKILELIFFRNLVKDFQLHSF